MFTKVYFVAYDPFFPLPKNERPLLPKNPFEQEDEAYLNIGRFGLHLNFHPPKLSLPDLRGELTYYIGTRRPDMQHHEAQEIQLALKSSGESVTVPRGQPIYLNFQTCQSNKIPHAHEGSDPIRNGGFSSLASKRFSFTYYNTPSPLWLEVNSQGAGGEVVQVTLHMFDEDGNLLETPAEHHKFILRAEEVPRSRRLQLWDLDHIRVNSSLLVRQKAHWEGADLFLEMHGGDEFVHYLGKQRIDFHHLEEDSYSCFIGVGDSLIWKDHRWQSPVVDEDTTPYPLLVLTRFDDKTMHFELWSIKGENKVELTLLKARGGENFPNIADDFRFLGAKTLSKFMVETPTKRMVVCPTDWFVLTDMGWAKLEAPEDIDDYVEQRLKGPLFVLDEMIKQNGRQMLIGHLFNTERTAVRQVEIPACSGILGEQLISLPFDEQSEKKVLIDVD